MKYGVRTVIDLRNSYELLIDPPPFADGGAFDGEVAYHNVPLIPEESEVAELVASASSTPDMYRHIVDGCRESIAAVMRVIAESGDGSVLIHCHAGKDRTGLISALLLALVSVPTPAIIDDYEHSNECLQPYNDEWLSAIADPEERAQQERSYRAEPEFMQAVLGYIDDTYGGVGAYLLGGGLSEAELQGLRSRMAG